MAENRLRYSSRTANIIADQIRRAINKLYAKASKKKKKRKKEEKNEQTNRTLMNQIDQM